MKDVLFILHTGKANYPDIDAYRNYFSEKYDVLDGTLDEYEKIDNKSSVILWCIMGFFSKKPEAKFIIHDYRSLSVGRFLVIKDKIKKLFNYKPDLRIFLNDTVRDVMGFVDEVPHTTLDMGVPEWIFNIQARTEIIGKYCYIGAMSYERQFDKVIDSFLKNKKEGDTFVLVGQPEQKLLEQYKSEKSLIFTGKVSQKEALEIVKSCEFAVCYFPYHRPHCYQTPTKLLEYAALGVNIICNDSPSNIRTLEKLKIDAVVTGSNIFDSLLLSKTVYSKVNLHEELVWENVIHGSKVESYI